MKKILIIQLFLSFLLSGIAQVKLPRLLRDSMVLQRDTKIKFWGSAAPSEKVSIRFNSRLYRTKADAIGNWMVYLPPTKAGGPYNIDIIASNTITLHDVLFGDVWFCSGQSNMVHPLNIHDVRYSTDIEQANYPQIRQFLVPTLTNLQAPKNDIPSGNWVSAAGKGVRPFSAVAFFFAKKLYEKYKVPIGIINASVGGTPIEAWMSGQGLQGFPAEMKTIEKNKDTAYVNSFNRKPPTNSNQPQPLADAGNTSTIKWFDTAYVPKGWHTINIPGYWADQGIKNLNGVVWYRREIDIPAAMVGKPARIFLGRIVDTDELYVNGQLVGNTGYLYPQRRYAVAKGILKAGKNIFVIRVTNFRGKGGFVPGKPYCIFAGKDTVDLKGDWQYKVGTVFLPFAGEAIASGINTQNQPAALYNAMVAPFINYAVKGFCWYQGESNTSGAKQYAQLLPALINDWRIKWGMGDLPFLYVQLPGFMDYNYLPSESDWALLRESQLKTLAVANTAMVVAIDLGEWNDIHPDNKKDVGERLAVAACKIAYKEDSVYSGPLFQSVIIRQNKIVISFNNMGSSLVTNDGEAPSEIAIAGADKKFVWASAKIEGDKIVAWSNDIPEPKYVRYAWSDNPVNPNLFNKEGLPASPFRTDE